MNKHLNKSFFIGVIAGLTPTVTYGIVKGIQALRGIKKATTKSETTTTTTQKGTPQAERPAQAS